MKKHIISAILFMILGINSFAQNKFADVIKIRAKHFSKATQNFEFGDVVNLTYPELVKVVNKDTLLNKLSNNMVSMHKEGLRYKSIKVDEPRKITSPIGKLYYVIPQKITKYNSRGEFYIKTYLFSVSNDEGKTWYFLTHKQFTKHQKQLFPGLEQEYKFPIESSVYILNKKFNSLLGKPK